MRFLKGKIANLRFEEFFPVAREQNIAESINLEQVSVNIVPPQSPDREVSIVLDVGYLLRVAEVDQSRLRQVKAKIFILKARQVKQNIGNCFAGRTSSALYSARV